MNHTKDEWEKHLAAKRSLAEVEWAARILEEEIALIEDRDERDVAVQAWLNLGISKCIRCLSVLARLEADRG